MFPFITGDVLLVLPQIFSDGLPGFIDRINPIAD